MTEIFDMKEFQKKFNDVLTENFKLQYIKERYMEIAQKLRDMSVNLLEISNSLAPQFQKSAVRRKSGRRAETVDKLNILYEKMVSGVELDSMIISTVMESEATHYYMKRLMAMPHVESRFSDHRRFLYIRDARK